MFREPAELVAEQNAARVSGSKNKRPDGSSSPGLLRDICSEINALQETSGQGEKILPGRNLSTSLRNRTALERRRS